MVIRKKMVRFGHLMGVIIDGPGAVGDVLEEMAVRLLAKSRLIPLGGGTLEVVASPLAEPVTPRNWGDLVNLVRDEIAAFETAMVKAPEGEKLAPGIKTTLWGTLTRAAAACLAAAVDLELTGDADVEEVAESAREYFAVPVGRVCITEPDYYKLKYEEERGKADQREGEAGALRRANNELESERNAARETIQRLERERDDAPESRGAAELEDVRNAHDATRAKLVAVRGTLADVESERKTAECILSNEKARVKAWQDEVKKIKTERDATVALAEANGRTIKALTVNLEDLDKQFHDIEDVRERLYLERADLQTTKRQLQEDLKAAKFIAEGERDGHARHQSIMKSLESRIATLAENLEVARGLLDIARTEKKQLQAELSKRMADLRNARERRNELWKVVEELRDLMRTGFNLARESQPKPPIIYEPGEPQTEGE